MLPPVIAEKVFQIGPLPITNSFLNGLLATVLFVILGLSLRRLTVAAPRGWQNGVEALLEFMLDFIDQVTHDRARSRRFLPIVGTLFLFILVSNWLRPLPGLGTIYINEYVRGELERVPLLRAATSDLNMTLALGIMAVAVSHVLGIFTVGLGHHVGKFVPIAGVWRSLRAFGRVPLGTAAINLFTAIVEVGVGLIELVSEAAKMVSLSLRLFGNVFAGEVLLAVMASLLAFFLPLPFMAMELVVGLVQAMVFSMLTLVFFTLATERP